MGDEKPATERTVTLPLYDADYLAAVNVLKNLYLGPGKPGPGDEWHFPREAVAGEAASAEPPDAGDEAIGRERSAPGGGA